MLRLQDVVSIIVLLALLFFSQVLRAQTTDNLTLLIFEGSDWCANCLRLEKEVLSDPQFELFSQRSALQIQRVDFPQRKKLDPEVRKYNESMAERYDFKGVFPTVLLVDDQGELISPIRYRRQDVFEFINLLRPHVEL